MMSLSILLLVMAKSSSAIVNLLNIIILLIISSVVKLRYNTMIPVIFLLIIGSCISSLWVMDHATELTALIGKDPTLTGRTSLWTFIWDVIGKHPWLGYGYGGFWQGLDGESAYIWRSVGWKPNHPHNGLLALWIDLGLLGVVLFLIVFVKNILKGLHWIRIGNTLIYYWPITNFIYLILVSLSESTLFSSNNLSWILYITGSCSTLTITPTVKSG